MSLSPFLGNVFEFVDFAMGAVVILIIWYVIKFFLIGKSKESSDDDSWAKTGGGLADYIKGKQKKAKREKEEKNEEEKEKAKITKRRKLLEPAKGFIIIVEQAAEKIKDDELKHKTSSTVRDAKTKVDKIENNLRSAKRVFRAAKLHEKGEKREYINKLYDYTEVIIKHFDDHVKGKVPAETIADADWNSQVNNIKNHANQIKGMCGYLITSIDKFIDEDKMELISGRAGGSSGAGGST